jgi:hypothetical protein
MAKIYLSQARFGKTFDVRAAGWLVTGIMATRRRRMPVVGA